MKKRALCALVSLALCVYTNKIHNDFHPIGHL